MMEKQIPDKLNYPTTIYEGRTEKEEEIVDKINEIIDYLEKKK